MSYDEIGRRFHRSRETIRRLCNRRGWKHLRFPQQEGWVTPEEYAGLKGSDIDSVYRNIRRGALSAEKAGRRYMVYVDSEKLCADCQERSAEKYRSFCSTCQERRLKQTRWRGINRRLFLKDHPGNSLPPGLKFRHRERAVFVRATKRGRGGWQIEF